MHLATRRPSWIAGTLVLAFLGWGLASPVQAQGVGPRLLFTDIESVLVTGIGHRIVGNDLPDGVVGNKVGVFGNTSAVRILGNRFDSNGTPETKYYEFDSGSSPASVVPSRNLVYGAGACEAWDTGCVNQDPRVAAATDY